MTRCPTRLTITLSTALSAIFGAAALVGCGPATPAPTPVVVIAAPPPVVTATATAEPVASSKGPSSPIPRGLLGVWEDMETHSHHTFVEQNGEVTVTAVEDTDGETYEIRTVEWKAGVLKWSYFVPSTGYLVRLKTTRLEGDTLWCEWANANASGEQEFQRVGAKH